jgi:hypothetical protein
MSPKPIEWSVLVVWLFGTPIGLAAQDLSRVPDSPAQRYYDYWIGTWHREVDGRADTSDTEFRVTREPSGTVLERWRVKTDGGSYHATGLRSFDKAWNRWMYVWTSDDGHFQVWQGRQVDGHWYIYREFDIAGDRYLSRQAWIPESPTRLTRVSEKSYDGGLTWELRFREFYRKTAP